MADFLTALKSGALLTDGAMGSYLFALTGRLSEANHVYEAFNVERPELVRDVHEAYIGAGARCLKTNTFGANHCQLSAYGLGDRLEEINRAGVAIARDAIERAGAPGDVYVLASIGPPADSLADAAAARACYAGQIAALAGAGPDAFLLETFASLPELLLVVDVVQALAAGVPVIAEMSVRPGEGEAAAGFDPLVFVDAMTARGVAVAGVNCCAPWDAGAFVDAVSDVPAVRSGALALAAMPNAGGFQRIGNRFMTTVNPEFAGKLARSLRDRGVRLIGGCCEMHPLHIQEMHNYLRGRDTAAVSASVELRSDLPPAGDDAKRGNGAFSRNLKNGAFAVSVEILPPRGTGARAIQAKARFVAELAACGHADALDITDGSRGIPLMPPGDFVHVLRRELGWTAEAGDPLEFIPHFTARDLNLMAIQSRLAGYHANGIHNVLFITGDPPKMSPTYPRSTAVFDVDSAEMIRLTHLGLNAGIDFGGTPLLKKGDGRTHFTIGTGFEPEAAEAARELERLGRKIANGADYVMTQPVFYPGPLAALEPYRGRCPIIVGIMLLAGLDHARRMAKVPGVVVPDSIMERLAAYADPADQAKAACDIAVEQVHWLVGEGWQGLYLMAPASHELVVEVLAGGLG